jgi:hypothetical protein
MAPVIVMLVTIAVIFVLSKQSPIIGLALRYHVLIFVDELSIARYSATLTFKFGSGYDGQKFLLM